MTKERLAVTSSAADRKGYTALSFVIPTEANPDFLPRSTGRGRVCAFP
jgi:hypothetical protein